MQNSMTEKVTFKGKPLTLKGKLIKEGMLAPDCELIDNEFKPIKLSSFKGKFLLLLTVPSLDTPVCSKEARHFNLEVEKLKDQVQTLCVSRDLPFAQARWCAAEGIANLKTLSDYKAGLFGETYGVFIQELALLARAVFILSPEMKVLAVYLVSEVTEEPDYSKILAQLNKYIKA